jgi:hypothetical protein
VALGGGAHSGGSLDTRGQYCAGVDVKHVRWTHGLLTTSYDTDVREEVEP